LKNTRKAHYENQTQRLWQVATPTFWLGKETHLQAEVGISAQNEDLAFHMLNR